MTVINYMVSILALAVLIYETYLVIRQNRRVTVKGKDDFFTFCLVLLFTSLLLRPDPGAEFVESLRNTLILMALFFTLAVKYRHSLICSRLPGIRRLNRRILIR